MAIKLVEVIKMSLEVFLITQKISFATETAFNTLGKPT